MTIDWVLAVTIAASVCLVGGCSGGGAEHEAKPAAVAEMHGTQGHDLSGKVTFTKLPGGILVQAELTGLTPGKHGFHVHEKGDCSAPDLSSAGDHFNTTGSKHGAREHMSAHTGDMGNIEVDETGKGHAEYVDTKLKLEGESSVIGKAVIVHEKTDDQVSQPSGNSGNRIACGVIQATH
jgi:Cu-Zn family superoxide dismutase